MEAALKNDFIKDDLLYDKPYLSTDSTTSSIFATKIENVFDRFDNRFYSLPKYNKFLDEMFANYNNSTSFEDKLIKSAIFEMTEKLISNLEDKKIFISNIEEIDNKDNYSIILSKRDWELILENLENPPEPTEYLVETMKKYKKGNKANHE